MEKWREEGRIDAFMFSRDSVTRREQEGTLNVDVEGFGRSWSHASMTNNHGAALLTNH